MKLVPVLLAVLVLATGAAASEPPLLAVVQARGSATLVRVDPLTLRELPGARLVLGRGFGAWSFSPDGSRVAIGSYAALGLRIADARTLRRVRDISTRNGSISFVAWLTPRRIIGWELSGFFAADPVTGRLLRYESITGQLMGAQVAGDAVVFLVSPYERRRSCRLVIAAADGRTRSVELERIRCSAIVTVDDDAPTETRRPGLAIDAAGRRAFVVGGEEAVAEIDLRLLWVDYHLLAERTPAARAKFPLPGSVRTAHWVAGGYLAVAGADWSPPFTDGRPRETPAGLRLIDTSSWTSRLLDSQATSVDVTGSTIYAYGEHDGIKAFAPDGSLRFHAEAGKQVYWLQRAGSTLYAFGGERFLVLDASSGAMLRELDRMPAELLAGRLHAYR